MDITAAVKEVMDGKEIILIPLLVVEEVVVQRILQRQTVES